MANDNRGSVDGNGLPNPVGERKEVIPPGCDSANTPD